jgi:hypothetical protein
MYIARPELGKLLRIRRLDAGSSNLRSVSEAVLRSCTAGTTDPCKRRFARTEASVH